MTSRRAALFVVGATLGVGAVAPSAASAAISVSSPVAHTLYVNSVFVSWTTTTTPTAISMVWTCTAGYCLHTVASPITLNLVSTATHGSFIYNPSSSAVSSFSNWPGPIPDGTWSIQMKYTDMSSLTLSSPTVIGVQTSTETLPPVLTGPTANAATNAPTIPVSYTLPSTPSVGSDPTLTFTNVGTSTASVLELSPSVTSGSFNLDPTNLSGSSSVLGLTGPNTLADGTYDVTIGYADTLGHSPASTTNSNWTLDRTTAPPSLSAPVAGSTETGPFDVTFDLPESALNGSVRLVFSGGSTPTTLSLSDASAGVHTVAIDPANLAGASDVLSASSTTLPAGNYNVAVAYQDALANPASTSSATSLSVAPPSTPTAGATTSTPTTTPAPPSVASSTTTATTPTAPAATTSPIELSPRVLQPRFATLSHQRIRMSLDLPAPGSVQVLATADDPHVPWAAISNAPASAGGSPLSPGWRRFRFAAVTTTSSGGHRSYTLVPTAKGAALIRRHRRHGWALHVRLTILYVGSGGQRAIGTRVVEILRPRRR